MTQCKSSNLQATSSRDSKNKFSILEREKKKKGGGSRCKSELDCVNEEGLISEILSQAPNIIVLEPQSLKDRIKRKILAFAKRQ